MLTPPIAFDDVMAPVGARDFFAHYEGQKPLHLKGEPDKFAAVMTWARLNDLLGQATIWAQASLRLVLDREPVAAGAYCAPAPGRDGGQVLRPDPAKVKTFVQKGATLVANDIDQLSPGLRALSGAFEAALGGKVQGNLYLSSRKRQGFAAHYDTHDVFAVHVEGTKTWRIYKGQAQSPIAHPVFKTLSREHHESAKGDLLMEVTLEPGDLLYLPRGQYHDALADEGGSVHIAFGVTYPIGLDVLSMMFERMVHEPVFRANLPRLGSGGSAALRTRLRELGAALAQDLGDEPLARAVERLQDGYRYPRDEYDLPDLLERPVDRVYRVRAGGIRLVHKEGRAGLLREGSKAAIEIPAEVTAMVDWVLKRQRFAHSELVAAFPESPASRLDQLVKDLTAMRLTEASD